MQNEKIRVHIHPSSVVLMSSEQHPSDANAMLCLGVTGERLLTAKGKEKS